MAGGITVDVVDEIKAMVYDVATTYSRGLKGLHYADIRLEVSEGKGAVAENGGEKYSAEDYGFSFGV
ncbi:MAG: TldD/PmbA family protein, partial [Dehalococcoidia bacterium]